MICYNEKMSETFTDITIVVVVATAFGMLARALKQPTLLGYIIAGLIIGPLGYLHFNNIEFLNAFAEIGIALLLFMVGLELNLKDIKHIGKAAVYAGVGQVVITFLIGFGLMSLLEFSSISALYVSLALTFSSTIVVVKLLSEKNDLESLYGKIVVGILLVQDIIAILALIFLSGSANTNILSGSLDTFLLTVLKGALVVAGVFLAGKKFFPFVLDKIGRSQEMLFIFSIAWGLGFATIMATETVGYSLEMGGLLAGLALASSSEHFQIASRIRPLRDFFILIFFVVLGSKMILVNPAAIFAPALILSLFVLIIDPLIVIVILMFLGYRQRTSFLAGLTVAQVSEFSLILMLLGERLGHVSQDDVSLVTFISVITMIGSSYMVWHGNEIYKALEKKLKFLDFGRGRAEHIGEVPELKNHVVLVGAHRTGSNILNALRELEQRMVVVDFNPGVVSQLHKRGVPTIYGDITDTEIQERANLQKARLVISTVPDMFDASALLAYMKTRNPHACVIVTAETDWEGLKLYREGADYVLLPHFLGGQQLASLIRQDHEFKNLHRIKMQDLKMIKENMI
ncbi:MAG: hypothetical protein A2939_04145 [Parcubacteria group bacterium RIFCSPLOWO2_01_FULL_48_18]|nr:MAG: hypothetical protein A2939_04145 [Parcubacteria group bacterium RIFCSPLOWO2_01_FULL_48_18]OHB24440.1 MAG: hypothetical protein A3J67_02275 [Parcubacteria group bacterium RIFCSPHIGHO2_02_FULL_48_10b]